MPLHDIFPTFSFKVKKFQDLAQKTMKQFYNIIVFYVFPQEDDELVSESKEQLLEMLELRLIGFSSSFLLDSGFFSRFGLTLGASSFYSDPSAAFGFFSGPLRLGGWQLRAAAPSFVPTTPDSFLRCKVGTGAARLARATSAGASGGDAMMAWKMSKSVGLNGW